jgi:hypothetical protein
MRAVKVGRFDTECDGAAADCQYDLYGAAADCQYDLYGAAAFSKLGRVWKRVSVLVC